VLLWSAVVPCGAHACTCALEENLWGDGALQACRGGACTLAQTPSSRSLSIPYRWHEVQARRRGALRKPKNTKRFDRGAVAYTYHTGDPLYPQARRLVTDSCVPGCVRVTSTGCSGVKCPASASTDTHSCLHADVPSAWCSGPETTATCYLRHYWLQPDGQVKFIRGHTPYQHPGRARW
jgi:hypothetical protein